MLESYIIEGGRKLQGGIKIRGAKNSALPILAASMLSDKEIILDNIPDVLDIKLMLNLLEIHGCTIERNNSISLNNANINNHKAPYEIISKMRASIWVLAPLLARLGKAEVPMPGGCNLGARQVDIHIKLLKAMGAEISTCSGNITAFAKNLNGIKFTFDKISVGATITGILAASKAKGQTKLINCAKEPEIQDLCRYLTEQSVQIEGIGTDVLTIEPCMNFTPTNYKIIPDRIVAGTYIMAALITDGDIEIENIYMQDIEHIMPILKEIGANIVETAAGVRVRMQTSGLRPISCSTEPYPGFPTDLQPQLVALMSVADGNSIILETIFENRLMHVQELCRLGADIKVIDAKCAYIKGVKKLSGSEVKACDLRASAGLILAGLKAEGTTVINRIHHLNRGYENMLSQLQQLGASVHSAVSV